MRSLAITPERELDCYPCCGPMTACEHSRKPYFPTLYLDAKQMPELSAMEVGEEYIITFTVKPRSLNKRETIDDDIESSGDLELLAYELKKAPKKKEEGDEDDNDGDD